MHGISVFDMLKIGVGPSSSHTLGPWRAALRFVDEMAPEERSLVSRITVELYGSLAKTGRGHGTDIGVQLGLCGADPETIPRAAVTSCLQGISQQSSLQLGGQQAVPFVPSRDITFHSDTQLSFHPNGITFAAHLADGRVVRATYYSVGGGFVVREGELEESSGVSSRYPIETAEDLLCHCETNRCRISDIVMQNELEWRTESEIRHRLTTLRDVMIDSVYRGCHTEGVLAGGLQVQRRAARMARRLLGDERQVPLDQWIDSIKCQPHEFRRVLDWVSCFALAVNEENAAFGRIVTAPTNGSAGVIPATLLYGICFCDFDSDATFRFLLTAAEIGCIFKQGATISGAMGGCQAEVGVSSAMAAAALTECLGGSAGQAAEAAEIAMEHHLGLTCDPVGGLVQIPCIERNAMGAIKAIVASELALQRDASEARVTLDVVVRTMWETAKDMNGKYKETSEGGLAVQIPVNISEC